MSLADFLADVWEAVDSRLPFSGVADFEAALDELLVDFDPSKEKVRITQELRNSVPAQRHCALCHGILTRRLSRYGYFYGCTNYPSCRYTRNELE